MSLTNRNHSRNDTDLLNRLMKHYMVVRGVLVQGLKRRRTLMNITDLIPVGKENAIKRHDLCRLLHKSDKPMRDLLGLAVDKGEFICNDQDGKGYYRPSNIDEMQRFNRQEYARGIKIIRRCRLREKKIKELSN